MSTPALPQGKVTKTKALRLALKGRQQVMRGERPPIRDALQIVLGQRTMKSRDIGEELKKRGWIPVSTNPMGYISYVLSKSTKHFQAVQRGTYRVKPNAPPIPAAIAARFVPRKKITSEDEWMKQARAAGWVPPTRHDLLVTLLIHPSATKEQTQEALKRARSVIQHVVKHPILTVIV